jgi:hypothetical protein
MVMSAVTTLLLPEQSLLKRGGLVLERYACAEQHIATASAA